MEPGDAGGVEHPAAGVLGGVAVAAAEAAGDDAPRAGVERRGRRRARRRRSGGPTSAAVGAVRPQPVSAASRAGHRDAYSPDAEDRRAHTSPMTWQRRGRRGRRPRARRPRPGRAAARSAGSPGRTGTIDSWNQGIEVVVRLGRPSRTPRGSRPRAPRRWRPAGGTRGSSASTSPSVARTRPASSPISCAPRRGACPTTMNSDAERGDDEEPVRRSARRWRRRRRWPAARSRRPRPTMSSTAMCFSQSE